MFPAQSRGIAALVLLFLSIAAGDLAKSACLVRTIWADFRAAFFEVLDFLEELRHRYRRVRNSELAHDLEEDLDST